MMVDTLSPKIFTGSTMANDKILIEFPGRIVFIGFGSIGQGTLPLVLRHIGIPKERITIIAADDHGRKVAESYGVKFVVLPLMRDNFRRELDQYIGRGDFVLNVSVDVSSIALIKFCWSKGAMYLDTCIEPWPGGYTDATIPHAKRTNYALREEALALRKENPRAPTAVLTHGANPGLVSHFVKQALLNVAADTGVDAGKPAAREDWGQLARKLGIKVIHIAERDTQLAAKPKEFNEFVNTWSVDGFVSEGQQPAELGWGTHERHFPPDGARQQEGSRAAIYLNRPGASTRVRSWTPLAGAMHGFLITHGESVSIADHLTVGDRANPRYRPTVHYAYHPCDDAVLSLHELAGLNWKMQR